MQRGMNFCDFSKRVANSKETEISVPVSIGHTVKILNIGTCMSEQTV